MSRLPQWDVPPRLFGCLLQFGIHVYGAVVRNGQCCLVGVDAVHQHLQRIVGNENKVDRRALVAGATGDAVEGVDAGRCADGGNLGAVGKSLLHVLNGFAVRVGVEITCDKNREYRTVLLAELIFLFQHLTDVIYTPYLALNRVGSLKIIGF